MSLCFDQWVRKITFWSGIDYFCFFISWFNCWKRLSCLLLLSWLQNIVQTIRILQSTSLLQKIQVLNFPLQSSLLFILFQNRCFLSWSIPCAQSSLYLVSALVFFSWYGVYTLLWTSSIPDIDCQESSFFKTLLNTSWNCSPLHYQLLHISSSLAVTCSMWLWISC